MQTFSPELFHLHGRDDNGSHFLTRDPRLTTAHCCSFQSWPLGGSALKTNITATRYSVETTELNWRCGLSCAVSLLFLESCWLDHGSTGHEYWLVTHVTHSDLLTHLTRDPLTHSHCHLCSVDLLRPMMSSSTRRPKKRSELFWFTGEIAANTCTATRPVSMLKRKCIPAHLYFM